MSSTLEISCFGHLFSIGSWSDDHCGGELDLVWDYKTPPALIHVLPSPYIEATMASFNPFAKRETHSASSLNTYRVLVPLSWALVVIVGSYYSLHSPDDTKKGKKIWKQANKHNTPFSQNTTVTGVYW